MSLCVQYTIHVESKTSEKILGLDYAQQDNGFGIFRNFLKYKLEEQGK